MPNDFKITVSPKAQRLLKDLPGLPARAQRGLAQALDLENQLSVGHIVSRYMSQRGPKTLGVITNRLRGSIRASKARADGGNIRASIGSNVKYLGIHEFGFHGVVQVRAHARRILDRSGVVATVRIDKKTGRLKYGTSGKVKTVGQVNVKAHTRTLDYAGRAPIRSGLKDRADNYAAALGNALAAAVIGKDGN